MTILYQEIKSAKQQQQKTTTKNKQTDKQNKNIFWLDLHVMKSWSGRRVKRMLISSRFTQANYYYFFSSFFLQYYALYYQVTLILLLGCTFPLEWRNFRWHHGVTRFIQHTDDCQHKSTLDGTWLKSFWKKAESEILVTMRPKHWRHF